MTEASQLTGPFRRLWASTAAANLGDGILFAGMPVLASTVTTSPLLISAVEVALFGPMLLAALPSGVAADRYDRSRVMSWANLIRAAGLVALALFVLTGQGLLAAVYLAAAITGLFETLSDSAAQTALPLIVPRDALTKANSRLVGTQVVLNDGVGAPLGSALATIGGSWLFGISAVLYGAGGVLAARLPRLTPTHVRAGESTARREIAEGFAFLWRHPALRRMGISNGIANLGNAAFFGIAILLFIGPYDLPRSAFGVALALLAVGGVAGAAVGDRVVKRIGSRAVLLLGAVSMGVGYAALGLLSNTFLGGAAFFMLGLTGMIWNVTNRVARQRLTPEPMLGRVTSVMRVTALGASPLGALLGGVVAEAAGLRSIVAITSCTALAAFVLLWRIPALSLQFDDQEPDSVTL